MSTPLAPLEITDTLAKSSNFIFDDSERKSLTGLTGLTERYLRVLVLVKRIGYHVGYPTVAGFKNQLVRARITQVSPEWMASVSSAEPLGQSACLPRRPCLPTGRQAGVTS